MTGGAIRRLEAAIAETEIDGECVLMNVETGSFFALRDTGLAIWRLIDGTRDAAAIVAALGAEYDLAPEERRRAVETFLGELAKAGLVAGV